MLATKTEASKTGNARSPPTKRRHETNESVHLMLSMLLLEVSANDGLSVVQHRADSIGGCAKLEHKYTEEQLCTIGMAQKRRRQTLRDEFLLGCFSRNGEGMVVLVLPEHLRGAAPSSAAPSSELPTYRTGSRQVAQCRQQPSLARSVAVSSVCLCGTAWPQYRTVCWRVLRERRSPFGANVNMEQQFYLPKD